MDNNIFMEDQKPLSFEQYLQYDEKSRSNLGETLPVLVYRMLEYSMKDELVSRLGKDAQIDIFRKAGQRSGEYFARKGILHHSCIPSHQEPGDRSSLHLLKQSE